MKPIEGVDLGELSKETALAYREASVRRIKDKMLHLFGDRKGEQGSITALEGRLAKARERLGKLEDKLAQLEAGNWGVLEDEALPKVVIQTEATQEGRQ